MRFVQPVNALSPMVLTELGMLIDVRLVQPENILELILVTEPGISQCVRFSSRICLLKLANIVIISNHSFIPS